MKADKKDSLSGGNSSAANYLAVRGKIIFDTIAFHCHGKKGEGGMGPAIMGPKSDLAKYKTAKELLNFISEEMPMDNPGGLKPEEYLAVLSYLLIENNFINGEMDMNPANLEKIELKK